MQDRIKQRDPDVERHAIVVSAAPDIAERLKNDLEQIGYKISIITDHGKQVSSPASKVILKLATEDDADLRVLRQLFSRFSLWLISFCLLFHLSLATHAELTGEIIFSHPVDRLGLWIGNVNDKHTVQKLSDVPLLVSRLSIQEGDRYIIAVADRVIVNEREYFVDLYLVDRKRLKEKNLTSRQYNEILCADISRNGDIVFTNEPFFPAQINKVEPAVEGIYLLPKHEIETRPPNRPQAELLFSVQGAGRIAWAPNGREFVFNTGHGIFLVDIFTRKVSHIIKNGRGPAFSPNGRHLAFVTFTIPSKLGILSFTDPHTIQYIEVEDGTYPRDLTWSPDGQYIVYTLFDAFVDTPYANFAVPVAGGPSERILEDYDGGVSPLAWTNVTYAVEPTNKLTTLWGKIKQQD